VRIVQLITQPRGGPVDHAVDVACQLARRGHDSQLIGPDGSFVTRLQEAGVTWHELAVERKTDVRGARELIGLIGRVRPDVLHCQDMRAGMVGRIAARRHAVPVVYTVHGVQDGLAHLVAGNAAVAPPRRRDSIYYLSIERLLARLTHARFVVPAVVIRDYLVEHVRLPPSSIDVVHNGIDVEHFHPSDAQRHDGVIALWLGLMGKVKRVGVLLTALVDVPEVSLLLAGSGPEHGPLQQLSADLGVSDRVEFRGHVAEPAEIFREADLFVLPSAAEALPLSLLQAMSSGLPVIATRVGGIPEIVRPGTDGLLVPPDDPSALAGALRELATSPQQRLTMGANARERVVTEFSLESCVDHLLEVYAKTKG